MRIHELREQRTAAAARARRLVDATEPAKWSDQDQKSYDQALAEVERLDRQIESTQRRMNAEAEAMFTGRKAKSANSKWATPEGKAVTVLSRDESLAAIRAGNVDPDSEVGFGELIRSVATGPKNARVRAALTSTDASQGGVSVPDTVLPQFIDHLRSKVRTIQAGAKTLMMDDGNVRIVRAESDPTSSWREENAPVATGDPGFSGLEFKAKTLASMVLVPIELLQDSVNIDSVLMDLFAGALAVQLDKAALVGTGDAPVPRGIWNTSGVPALDPDPAMDYDAILDAWDLMATNNSNDPTGVIAHPKALRALRGLKDLEGRYLRPPESLIEMPLYGTTSMGEDQVIVGDWERLVIGIRQQLRVVVAQQTFADKLQVAFIAYLRADVGVETAKSFVKFEIDDGE